VTIEASSAYHRTAGHSAGPVRLLVLLYEQLVKDLRRALAAGKNNDVEGRAREIDHALTVVGHLQGTLDLERGGEVANNVDRFYSVLRVRLLQSQFRFHVSEEILLEQIAHLLLLREAWMEVDRSMTEELSSAQIKTTRTEEVSTRASTDWSG